MTIKIIAGMLRGRIIKGPPNERITRPILARVRKSLFDILSPILENAVFLDLFCGTGAVGIEAVSRGAKKVVFLDKSKDIYKRVNDNIGYCKIQEQCEVFCLDVFSFLKNYSAQKFDIVFAGPPYPANLCNDILEALSNSNCIKKDTLLILQHHKKEILPEEYNDVFFKNREKIYGDTKITFYKTSYKK